MVRHLGLSRGHRRGDRGGAGEYFAGRDRAEPLQPRRPQVRGRARVLRGARASASSRGSRSPPGELAAAGRRRRRDRRRRTTRRPGQVALAWLLQRSPVMLPIPGTELGRAPRGERRRGRARAQRRRDRTAGPGRSPPRSIAARERDGRSRRAPCPCGARSRPGSSPARCGCGARPRPGRPAPRPGHAGVPSPTSAPLRISAWMSLVDVPHVHVHPGRDAAAAHPEGDELALAGSPRNTTRS